MLARGVFLHSPSGRTSVLGQLSLAKVRKSYDALEIIKGVDLDIRDGEFVVFVGPSG